MLTITLPCGLIFKMPESTITTWLAQCDRTCPENSRPFCFMDGPAVRCLRFHSRNKRTVKRPSPAAEMLDAIASLHVPLPGQKNLW